MIFHHDLRLMVVKPKGVLDNEWIEKVMATVTAAESQTGTAFNRFVDLSAVTQFRLDPKHAYRVATVRRMDYVDKPTMKSAYYVTTEKAAQLANICAIVTKSSPLQVRVFNDIPAAAEWLGVSEQDLAGNL
ncbi:MAG TPA: hypothetical protein VGM62_11035 [Chthoniobacterales bacterium]|jgi:hypothetical protein